MSSICGTIDYTSSSLSFDKLLSMARAMRLRGTDQSGAYLNGGVGIQHNRTLFRGNECDRQPFMLTRDNTDYVLTLDGEISNKRELSERLGLSCEVSDERILLEGYISFGTDLLSMIEGAFAFAIYDHRQKELILVRDNKGAKPLFYTFSGSVFLFASSIKALLSHTCCFEVDRAAISEFILSEVGSMRGSDLYRDIHELPEGCFALFSRLGVNVCEYRKKENKKEILPQGIRLSQKALVLTLTESLEASLFAFEHPSFDEYTQSYTSLLSGAERGTNMFIEDPAIAVSERYALERADRLGTLYGISVTPTDLVNDLAIKKKELLETEKKLAELVGKLFESESAVRSILGTAFPEKISNEKDVKRRIKALGMTYQTELWLKRYSVIPVQ